ncbi:hypothetical protein GEV02_11165 [Rugamonas sp. FT29W]|uniref:Uncharacterized protein n=1 Tax=Rugamonas aquatica TaxID=2743357 RepID=A0A6A7N107_9BURK|nr:hypothetical protein [Rugamonas aquatica]
MPCTSDHTFGRGFSQCEASRYQSPLKSMGGVTGGVGGMMGGMTGGTTGGTGGSTGLGGVTGSTGVGGTTAVGGASPPQPLNKGSDSATAQARGAIFIAKL